MEIKLTPQLLSFVEEKVRAGQFKSVDEVILNALSVYREEEELLTSDLAELREEVAIGVDQLARGESAPWDAAEVKARLTI